MVRRGRPKELPNEVVRIDLYVPKTDAMALLRLYPQGYNHGIRHAIRELLKQSIEWTDQELRKEDERHAEARAYLHEIRQLAKKNHLSFNEEQLRKIRARATQVSLLSFDPAMHRNWALAVGFTLEQAEESANVIRELLTA